MSTSAPNNQQTHPTVSNVNLDFILVTQATISFHVSIPSNTKTIFNIRLYCMDDIVFSISPAQNIELLPNTIKYSHTFTHLTSNHRYNIKLYLYKKKTSYSKHEKCKQFKPIKIKFHTKATLPFIISYLSRCSKTYYKTGKAILHLIESFTEQLLFQRDLVEVNVSDDGLTIKPSVNNTQNVTIIRFGSYMRNRDQSIHRVQFSIEKGVAGKIGFGFVTPQQFDGRYYATDHVCLCYNNNIIVDNSPDVGVYDHEYSDVINISSGFENPKCYSYGGFQSGGLVTVEANMIERIGNIFYNGSTKPIFTVNLPICVSMAVSIASGCYCISALKIQNDFCIGFLYGKRYLKNKS